MSRVDTLRRRREDILAELADLETMRRGSIVPQYVRSRHKDGSVVRRGPYWLYSFKEKGKTVSRRLKSEAEARRYQAHIEAFRRFDALVKQLRRIGEELCDLEAGLEEKPVQKKTPKPKRSKSRPPRTRKSPHS